MRTILAALLLASFAACASCPMPLTSVICTEWTLYMFLANGDVKTRDFSDLKSCIAVQQVISGDHETRGDHRIDRMMCLPTDARAFDDPAQRVWSW
jgi:hypothetical protein